MNYVCFGYHLVNKQWGYFYIERTEDDNVITFPTSITETNVILVNKRGSLLTNNTSYAVIENNIGFKIYSTSTGGYKYISLCK